MKKNLTLLLVLSITSFLSCNKDTEPAPNLPSTQAVEANPLFLIKINGKYGYIDKTGKVIIPPIHGISYGFSESLAAVSTSGNSAVIDKLGNMKISLPNAYVTNFMEGRAIVSNSDNTKSVIDTTGRIITTVPNAISHYHEGLLAVVIGNSENWLLPQKK